MRAIFSKAWKNSKGEGKEEEGLFPPGFEPGTFRVLGERDDHYTTETDRHSVRSAEVVGRV